ncbi:V-type ATP synthase subunit E [Candidatus Micrarchaeota archaeon]|nr:V-type ATP synthase subunit E [Candidatus Micrarchaeota archaeon]
MSMDRVIDSLLAEAKAEARMVLQEAEKSAKEEIEKAKKENQKKLKSSEEDAEKRLENQRRERIAWARLEKKRILAEAKEDAISGVMDELYGMLSSFRKSKEYPKFMKRKLSEALDELETSNVVVHVAKGDKKYINGKKLSVAEDLDAAGGLVVESKDGKVRVDSTLESLFEYSKPELRKEIYSKMFGGS